MIEDGTIVVVIDGGNLQEVYCQGEEREYILADYDDQAADTKWIREGTTDPDIPEKVRQDVEIDRARQEAEAKHAYLMLHLRALLATPPTVAFGESLLRVECAYCGAIIQPPQMATMIKWHNDKCPWAKATKAVTDANV